MKTYVFMNSAGLLGLAVRVTLTDNVVEDMPLGKLEGYSLTLRANDYDGYLIANHPEREGTPWLFVNKEFVDGRLEFLGEL